MAQASQAMEWSQLSTRYLLDAALRATRNSDLYLVLLDCAARQPGALAHLTAQAPGAEAAIHANEIMQACSQFLAQLAQLAAASGVPAPQLRDGDVTGWIAALTNYMKMNGLREPAPGDPAAMQRLLHFGSAYFTFVGALTRIGAQAEERRLRHVLAQFDELKHPEPMIRLRAPVDGDTTAELLVQNTRSESAVVSCRVPQLRSVNGVGPAFAPGIVIQPNDFVLGPAQEARVRISLQLAAARFAPATSYVGELHLRRGEEPEVRIPLRVETAGRVVTP